MLCKLYNTWRTRYSKVSIDTSLLLLFFLYYLYLLTRPPICDAPVRTVLLEKPPEGSVGIRLTGGNKVGIFVSAVQPGIAASLQGLQPGDKLLKVNQVDMTGVTREDAAMFLLRVQDRVTLEVQLCKQGKAQSLLDVYMRECLLRDELIVFDGTDRSL